MSFLRGKARPVGTGNSREKENGMLDIHSGLTAADVGRLLRYDEETGALYWRVSLRKGTAGKLAGRPAERGRIEVRIYGKTFKAHRLIWLMKTAPIRATRRGCSA